MFKFLQNKILITTFILLIIIITVSIYFFLNNKSETTQQFCSTGDDYVMGIVSILQKYYKENKSFPIVDNTELSNDKEILDLIKKQYEVDIFSNAGSQEMFIYFKTNCKLQILPNEYNVYPK